MPYYIFLEDEKGKLGYNGRNFFSQVEAEEEAEDIPGITHIIEADSLVDAKRKLRYSLVKKGKVDSLYKNVRRKRHEDS